jgi:CIC family chloride channel protein
MQGKQATQRKALNPLAFSLISVLVGVIAGLGAVAFRGLIGLIHNLLFLGTLSVSYDANVHTPASPWGPFVILVPVVGALGVAFLVTKFAPEAKGHGVPEVMDAIYYQRGIIRPVVAVVKSLASALSIGSGGSIGREGPIIQIGSSFGSTVGQLIPLPTWQRVTLIAGGAAGGIAATFNTPVGGILFAAELMMQEVSARTLVPVAISTATATYIGRVFLGVHPSFTIPAFEQPYFHLTNPLVLFSYVGLGLLFGVVSTIFIRSIYAFEDFFDQRIKANYYVRHAIGMLLVGIMIYLLKVTWGHYYVEGVGYATVQDVLTGTMGQFGLLMTLFVLKLLATSLTLGSGASGGIFSPSLFMGATLGGAYGVVLQHFFPHLSIAPPAFAVAGMAGMVGGTTGAAVASIVMIFEMTLDYDVIIPMTITVALSYGVRMLLSRESIYTMKLVRRGHYMPEALQTNFYYQRRANAVMETHIATVPASSTVGELARTALEHKAIAFYLIQDHDKVIGVVAKEAVPGALAEYGGTTTVREIANIKYATVTENATLFDVMTQMRANKASIVLVGCCTEAVMAQDVNGIISSQQIIDAMKESVEPFSD